MSLIKHAFLCIGVLAFTATTVGCAADDEDAEEEIIAETEASELNGNDSIAIDWKAAVAKIEREAPNLDVYTPARLPNGILDGTPGRIYLSASTYDYKGKQYSINFDYTKDCNGANVCTAGFIVSSAKPNVFRPNGKINGVPIRFEDVSCGASCAPASISWIAGNRQITLALKASRKDIVGAVKSALHGGAR